MNLLVIVILTNIIAVTYCGPNFLLRGPTAQVTIYGQDGTKIETQAIAGKITSRGVIGPTFKAITIVDNNRLTNGGHGASGQSSHDCGSACGGDSAYLASGATKYDPAIVEGPPGSGQTTIYGQDGSKIVSQVEPGSISANGIIGPTFKFSSARGEGASGQSSPNCNGNCGSTSASHSNPYPGQNAKPIYSHDESKILNQIDSGSIPSEGIIGPTFKASTSVENTQGSISQPFKGPTGTSDSHPHLTQSTTLGEDTNKIFSQASAGSILSGGIVGPTFTASTTVQNQQRSAGNGVRGQSSYNCGGTGCGVGSVHLSSEGTQYNPSIIEGPEDTSNSHRYFGQSTVHGQGPNKIYSQPSSGLILNGGIVGPTLTASSTVQDAQPGQSSYDCGGASCGVGSGHSSSEGTKYNPSSQASSGSILNGGIVGPTFTASTTVQDAQHGQSSYGCGGATCGHLSNEGTKYNPSIIEGPADTSNSLPQFGQSTIHGHGGSKISSEPSSGAILNGGILGPTFTASTTIQDAQHGQPPYDCSGAACGVSSGHLSSEGTKHNPSIIEGPVDTSNSQPHFGESTVLGQRRSEISSPASSGSILNGGIVGPTFTASNTIQNARHGQSSYDCDGGACGIDNTHLSNDGAQYNRIIEEEATNTSNPNHSDQATIYGQAHGRSISSEGVVGPGFGTSTSVESTLAGEETIDTSEPKHSEQDIVYGQDGSLSQAHGGSISSGGIVSPAFGVSTSVKNTLLSGETRSILKPKHSEQETIYGKDGSKIVSQVHGGSISDVGIVAPITSASTSVENALAGGENSTGESPPNCGRTCGSDNAHVSKEGAAYNPTGTNSHPHHEQSTIHGQAESKIVSEASAGSILNKGIVAPSFKAYSATSNTQFTVGQNNVGKSPHKLSSEYVKYNATITQEPVRTSNSISFSSGNNAIVQGPYVTSSVTGPTSAGKVAGSGSGKHGYYEFLHSGQNQINGEYPTPSGSIKESEHFEYNGAGYNNPSSHSIVADINTNTNGFSGSSIMQLTPGQHDKNIQSSDQGQNGETYDSSLIASTTHTHPNKQFKWLDYYHVSPSTMKNNNLASHYVPYVHPDDVLIQYSSSNGNNKPLISETNKYIPSPNNEYDSVSYRGYSSGVTDGTNSGLHHGSGNSNPNFGNGEGYIESSSFAPATYRRPDSINSYPYNVGSNTQVGEVSSFRNNVQGRNNASYDCYVIKFPINAYSSDVPSELSLFLKKLVQSSSIKPDVYYLHKHYHRQNRDY